MTNLYKEYKCHNFFYIIDINKIQKKDKVSFFVVNVNAESMV